MNLPNKLSVMRILLVPLIVILYLLPQHTDILHEQLALASFTFDLRDLLVLALFACAAPAMAASLRRSAITIP